MVQHVRELKTRIQNIGIDFMHGQPGMNIN